MDKNKKILITSALPYVNNIPHLGNLIGAVLSADVFARFARSAGYNVRYICGADEHGTATETKAREEGLTPKEICDKYIKIHEEIYSWFSIEFDHFGRTSKEIHHEIVKDIFKKVNEHEYITQKTVEQLFCKDCNSFLADRFVRGTCPHCGYEDAGGDQCDTCGKLLNPTELIEPKCKTHKTTPEIRTSEHLFLDLHKLQPLLEKWVEEQSVKGFWTENTIRTTKAWFKEGLKERAISRDLKWGIKIPLEGFEDKVFYVWFDAPIGYISITADKFPDWKEWWKNPSGVELYQFMGKDNIPFHSIIFPGTLIAENKDGKPEYTTVHHINSTEYLNYEHTKFSKSNNIGVFGDNAKDSGLDSDIFRYVMLYNRPEGSDTQFTWKGLQERVNNELVANFGNLVNRTITFINKFFEGKLERQDLEQHQIEFLNKVKDQETEITEGFERVELRENLFRILKISNLGNQFFQENEPWKSRNDNIEKCKKDLWALTCLVKDLAILVEPYIPKSSKQIFYQLGIEFEKWDKLGIYEFSEVNAKPEILFKKIEDDQVKELRAKYGSKNEKEEIEKSKNANNEKSNDESKSDKLELRVGKIIEIKKHPEAEKLYIETVDIGAKENITIVSGLVPYYKEEELLNQNIIVVRNLKPAKLRGIRSEGMLLAASVKEKDANGNKELVEVVFLPNAKPGDYVGSKKSENKTKDIIDFDEFMKYKLETKEGIAYINGEKLLCNGEEIKLSKVKNGLIG